MISLSIALIALAFAITVLITYQSADSKDVTMIGTIRLNDIDEENKDDIIKTKLDRFLGYGQYQIKYLDQQLDLSLSDFSYDLDQTIKFAKEHETNLVVFNLLDPVAFTQMLNDQFSNQLISYINIDELVDQILDDLGQMITIKYYQLNDYLKKDYQELVLNEVVLNDILLTDVNQILDQVNQIDLLANQRFSVLEQLGNLNLSNEQLSMISTSLLELLLKSHMNGFVFHSYLEEPVWANDIYHVRILKVNSFDFSFYNGFDNDYQVWIEKKSDTSIAFSLIGPPTIYTYQVTSTKIADIESSKVYQTNTLLDETTPGVIQIETDTEIRYEKLITQGHPGAIYIIEREIQFNGVLKSNDTLFMIYDKATSSYYELNIVELEGA